jgi:hypothetical protein
MLWWPEPRKPACLTCLSVESLSSPPTKNHSGLLLQRCRWKYRQNHFDSGGTRLGRNAAAVARTHRRRSTVARAPGDRNWCCNEATYARNDEGSERWLVVWRGWCSAMAYRGRGDGGGVTIAVVGAWVFYILQAGYKRTPSTTANHGTTPGDSVADQWAPLGGCF